MAPSPQAGDPAHQLSAPLTPLAQDSVAILVSSLATRLNRGATDHYQRHFGIGMAEFRIVMALGQASGLNIGEVATWAEVDKAAASRALHGLQQRGFVGLKQTVSRGRAAIVHLTAEGEGLELAIRQSARRRERRLLAAIPPKELELAVGVLHKLLAGVTDMNNPNLTTEQGPC